MGVLESIAVKSRLLALPEGLLARARRLTLAEVIVLPCASTAVPSLS